MTSTLKPGNRLTHRLATIAVVMVLFYPIFLSADFNARFDKHVMSFTQAVKRLGSVTDIEQDRFGFIWMAGERGLARYEGNAYRLYQVGDLSGALPELRVWGIAISPQGDFWVATSRGICQFIVEKDQFDCPNSFAGDTAPTQTSTAINFDTLGRLYVATPYTAYRIDFITNTLVHLPIQNKSLLIQQDKLINDIAFDEQGKVLFATNSSGLIVLDPNNDTTVVYDHNNTQRPGLPKGAINSILPTTKDQVWVGTSMDGLYLLNRKTNEAIQLSLDNKTFKPGHNGIIHDIMLDRRGDIWVTADHLGIYTFDRNGKQKAHSQNSGGDLFNPSSNQARALYEDLNGDIWVGLFPFGANFIDRSQKHISIYTHIPGNKNSLSSNAVLALLEGNHNEIWIGTENGLNLLNKKTQQFKHFEPTSHASGDIASNAIISIEKADENHLWIGIWSSGLHLFDKRTQKFIRPASNNEKLKIPEDESAWSILKDNNNEIWFGGQNLGLQHYHKATQDFEHFSHKPDSTNSISNNHIRDIVQGNHDDLWLATDNGLNRFNKETATFTVWHHEPNNSQSLSSSQIRALFYDNAGFIWAGTKGHGLNRFDPNTGNALRFGLDDGLPSLSIASIIADAGGVIWITTSNGVAQINPQTFEIKSHIRKTTLANTNFNRNATLLSSDNTLYFGGTEGITAFNPLDLELTESIHPIYFTRFRLFNREVPIGPDSPLSTSIYMTKTIHLNYTHSMISFDFTMLNYRRNSFNEYAYKLKGFDSSWQYIGQRSSATYTNLSPGKYQIMVRARQPGGTWQESEHTITLKIAPPPWKSWWALAIYGSLCLLLMYIIYRVAKLKHNSEIYRKMAITDHLTGLHNRAGIQQVVNGLFLNKEIKDGVIVILIDIDHFKDINDTFGHDAGDIAIKNIAEIIRTTMRRGDYCGRWGGEEFILLCPGGTSSCVKTIGEKIRQAVDNYEFHFGSIHTHMTISAGAALTRPQEYFDNVCKRADKALYRAKNKGRNRVEEAEDD